jgi:hypothetical protein
VVIRHLAVMCLTSTIPAGREWGRRVNGTVEKCSWSADSIQDRRYSGGDYIAVHAVLEYFLADVSSNVSSLLSDADPVIAL